MSAVKKAFGQVKEISGEVKAKINDIREKEWAEPTGAILKGRFHKKLKTSENVEDCVLILQVAFLPKNVWHLPHKFRHSI